MTTGTGEEHPAEVEIRYRQLVEHLPAIVYTESVEGYEAGLVYVSPQIRDILDIDPEDWIGSPDLWLSTIHPDDRERVRAQNEHADATGEPFVSEYRVVTNEGGVLWFHDESTLMRDDDGRPLFWQGIIVDITERKRADDLERALQTERQVASELRALDEMKNTFLQAVSHDLRTPLAAILGLAVTLEREDVELSPEDARDLAGRIAANARKLDRMVGDLLDLDRLSRGFLEPDLVATDLGDLVARLVAGSDLLADRPVSVDAVPVIAEVDPAKIERILENLLSNSVRHTPSGTPIWVSVREQDDGALLVVEDEGPGVPAEHRDSIFKPFQQGPGAPTHSPGVGIGLSLVARFAELHGGRAWVETREGGGASFRVWLPKTRPR